MKRGIVAVLAVVLAYAPAVAPAWDVFRVPDGMVIEGSFVDGKREGRWVIRAPNGKVAEGPYVDGKREGHWVIRAPDGKVAEGPYVDGKQEGRWVVRFPSGAVWEGPYGAGKPSGRWLVRFGGGGPVAYAGTFAEVVAFAMRREAAVRERLRAARRKAEERAEERLVGRRCFDARRWGYPLGDYPPLVIPSSPCGEAKREQGNRI